MPLHLCLGSVQIYTTWFLSLGSLDQSVLLRTFSPVLLPPESETIDRSGIHPADNQSQLVESGLQFTLKYGQPVF
jgi:hypothetical protein